MPAGNFVHLLADTCVCLIDLPDLFDSLRDMEQSPWETVSSSVRQETVRILWKLKLLCCLLFD